MDSPREQGNVLPLMYLAVYVLYTSFFTDHGEFESIGPYFEIEFWRQVRDVYGDVMPTEQARLNDLTSA